MPGLSELRMKRLLAEMSLYDAAAEANRRSPNYERRLDESRLSRLERGHVPCPEALRKRLLEIYREHSASPSGEAA